MPCVCLSLSLLSFPGIFGEFPFLVLDRPPFVFPRNLRVSSWMGVDFSTSFQTPPRGDDARKLEFLSGDPKRWQNIEKNSSKRNNNGGFSKQNYPKITLDTILRVFG